MLLIDNFISFFIQVLSGIHSLYFQRKMLNLVLLSVLTEPLLTIGTPLTSAVIKLAKKVIENQNSEPANKFAEHVEKHCWIVVGEIRGKCWTPKRKEEMWRNFQVWGGSCKYMVPFSRSVHSSE